MTEPTQPKPVLSGRIRKQRPGIKRTVSQHAADIYCITHPKGENYAKGVVRRLVHAGRLIVSGGPNEPNSDKTVGQHGINR
jgi:hypothetical protein